MKTSKALQSQRSLDKFPDTKLIRMIRRGSRPAFDAMIHHHDKWLLDKLFFRFHDWNKEKEVYQDFRIRLWNTIRKGLYHDEGNLRNWLGKMLLNVARQFTRRKRNFVEINPETEGVFLPSCEDGKVLQLETDDELRNLEYGLKEDERDVLNLKYYGDLSDKEIAEITHKSLSATKSKLHRARVQMQKQLPYHLGGKKKRHHFRKLNAAARKKIYVSANDDQDQHVWRKHAGHWVSC